MDKLCNGSLSIAFVGGPCILLNFIIIIIVYLLWCFFFVVFFSGSFPICTAHVSRYSDSCGCWRSSTYKSFCLSCFFITLLLLLLMFFLCFIFSSRNDGTSPTIKCNSGASPRERVASEFKMNMDDAEQTKKKCVARIVCTHFTWESAGFFHWSQIKSFRWRISVCDCRNMRLGLSAIAENRSFGLAVMRWEDCSVTELRFPWFPDHSTLFRYVCALHEPEI